MQDCAVSLEQSPLQRETARQNRILQESLEQKKKQAGGAEPRAPAPRIGTMGHGVVMEPAVALPEELRDKIRRIPAMRSALIPLEEGAENGEWSLPFSLPKADMEPWQSFLNGYRKSRLFSETPARQRDAAESSEPQPDFAIRALMELKRVDVRIILEPPVQISGPVEYLDLDSQLRGCRDATLARSLAKVAAEVHATQLSEAAQKGRELGDQLHDALLGDGHGNLIRAWEKARQRKPTVDELHLMLTTGRVKGAVERRQPAVVPQHGAVPSSVVRPVRESSAARPARPTQAPAAREKPEPQQDTTPEALPSWAMEAKTETRGHKRKILLHLFHTAVCCAALVAYGFAF